MLMQIVTLLELATLLKVSRATIYRRVKAKEIRNNLEMIGYSTDDKLHEIVQEGRDKLDKLEQAIANIQKSRDELYVKFAEEQVAKKKISIDDIIRGFSQLNYILADREPEMHA